MFANEVDFCPPMDARMYITPKDREVYFNNLLDNYEAYFPEFTLSHAALNYDDSIKVDFCVVFTVSDERGEEFVIWDTPILYSARALPGYKWAVKNNMVGQYFEHCMSCQAQMKSNHFRQFIGSELVGNLTTKKDSDKFWKRPEHAVLLMDQLSEISFKNRPTGFKAGKVNENLPPLPPPTRVIKPENVTKA